MWYDELYNKLIDICAGFVKQYKETFIVDDRYQLFLEGFKNTLIITIGAAVIGCIIGIVIAITKVSYAQTGKYKLLDKICNLYLTLIRGTPVVVQLMIVYYIILSNYKQAVVVAIITFGINSGAYVAEIVRAGIMSVDTGQMEAGRSMGLSSGTTMRHIIIPQAIKNILPALGNEFITLLKETSVVGYVPIIDFTNAGNIIRSQTLEPFFSLFFVALGYLVLVMIITYVLKRLERRLRRSDRR